MQSPPSATTSPPVWLALPLGVLRLIFCLASTWQTPGACLAAAVCRTWRAAAAGCHDIRLLYFPQNASADGFIRWFKQYGHQLGALTLGSYYSGFSNVCPVLQALVEAAAAAKAAGTPLPLHTLRIHAATVTLEATSKLLSGLPNLRALQLRLALPYGGVNYPGLLTEGLGPLNQATQLEELYISGVDRYGQDSTAADVAALLPPSLRRLGWESYGDHPPPDLSHLKRLTFLQLYNGHFGTAMSPQLAPGLQGLQLHRTRAPLEVLEAQPQVVTAWAFDVRADDVDRQLSQLKNLRKISLSLKQATPAVRTALAQHAQLSSLHVYGCGSSATNDLQAVLAAAASIRNLRHLGLDLDQWHTPAAAALAALTGLTRLSISVGYVTGAGYGVGNTQQFRAWSGVVSRVPGLQWLEVPAVLVEAGCIWLVGLQQLRVLVLDCKSVRNPYPGSMDWLEACTQEALPPQLQVLALDEGSAQQAKTMQMRQRLQHRLGSSGCEVVTGLPLERVSTMEVGGFPVPLQRALGLGGSLTLEL